MPYELRSRTKNVINNNNNKEKRASSSVANQNSKKIISNKKDITSLSSVSKSISKKPPKITVNNNKKSNEIMSKSKNDEINTINKSASNVLSEDGNPLNLLPDSLKTADDISQNTTESLELRKVFIRNYIDIVNRIKLNTVPECLKNLLYCQESHSEDSEEPSMATFFVKSKTYLINENRLIIFSKIANLTTNSCCFWGNEMFFTIFRIILTVKAAEDLGYSPDYVIEEYLLLFENLIRRFPPCWKKIHPEYEFFLLSEIKTIDYLPQKPDSIMHNIVIFIINELYEACQEENDEISADEELNTESSQFFNYNIWEAEEMKANLLCVHSREEKLNRFFICLQLINKIFETDLSSWMISKLVNPSEFIFTKDGPLICRVFNITEFTFVTNSIKTFLQLFIKCVCCEYPKESINIMERLLSLIAAVSNLADISANDNSISYPTTGKMTDKFADNFFKTMENIIGTDIQMYVTVIEAITIPFMKYKLINLLLRKVGSIPAKKFCLEVIYDDLSKYGWLTCSESPVPKDLASSKPDSKYPLLVVTKKTTATDCYQEDYLKIQLEGIKSYCDFYCLNKFALILMDKPSEDYLKIKTPYSFNSKKILSKEKIHFDYDTIDEDELDKMLETIDYCSAIEEDCSESSDIIDEDALNIGLLTDEEQSTYLNDIHCMMRLQKNLPLLNKKYAGQFDEWCEYFEEFFQHQP